MENINKRISTSGRYREPYTKEQRDLLSSYFEQNPPPRRAQIYWETISLKLEQRFGVGRLDSALHIQWRLWNREERISGNIIGPNLGLPDGGGRTADEINWLYDHVVPVDSLRISSFWGQNLDDFNKHFGGNRTAVAIRNK